MTDHTATSTLGRTTFADAKRKLLVFLGDSMTEHELPDTGTVLVGRDASMDIRIDHPTLSRRHAKLTLSYHVTIGDEGSRNGTIVGGRRLAQGEVVLVAPGASIEVGDALLVLRANQRADVLGTSEGDANSSGLSLERKLARIAKANVAVVVAGENGVGKRFVAERIHALSAPTVRPFVELRCHPSVEPAEIADVVRAAAGGTLFLREPSALGLEAQIALAKRLAATSSVRTITSTTNDLGQLVKQDAFAPDLLQRLGPLSIVIPPLRARQGELASIVEEIVKTIAAEAGRPVPLVSADALAMLGRHTWPGNVRELKDAVTRAMLLGTGRVLTASHFSFEIDLAAGAKTGTLSSAVSDAEYRRILEVLRECSGNQSRAAKVLGISRGTLISRLERFGIPRPRK
jgi:DNA-binding NtrC family response regulator